VAHAESSLTVEERISLLGDEWAMMRAGHATVGDYLDLVGAVHNDSNSDVLGSALGKMASIQARIADEPERVELQAWVRKEFSPAYQALGPASATESDDKKEMRSLLFGVLGAAKDPAIIAEARQTADRYLADQTSVDPAIAGAALGIAAANGDAALYDKLLALSKSSTDAAVKTQSLFLTARFADPALVKRTLDSVAAGEVRNQDSWILLNILLQIPQTREQTWEYMQQNWDKVQAQFTTFSGAGVVGATGSFCSAEKRDEVQSFFKTHPVKAAERALKTASEAIDNCIELHNAQSANLKTWLAMQGAGATASGSN